MRYDAGGTSLLLPALAGNGSRPAGGSAVTPRGIPFNTGSKGAPPPPAPRPTAGATMTGRVTGGIGRATAAAPTPGTESMTDGADTGGGSSGGNCIFGGAARPPPDTPSGPPPPPPPPPGGGSPS